MRRLLYLLAFCILLTACTQQNNQKGPVDYNVGTQGVEISFLKGNPPDMVYEGDELEIVLELQNKGNYPEKGAPKGRVYLSGYDKNAINGLWE